MKDDASESAEWVRLSLGESMSTVTHWGVEELADGLSDALWVTDANTDSIAGAPEGVAKVVLPVGEAAKSWPAVDRILRAAVEREIDRHGRFVGFGGGVVCDVAAFAASIYLRGVAVTLIPTSLLAMVDAAIGGKTGINFAGFKNMVGTFHAAEEVRVCEVTTHSLSEREFRSGLAEAIKAALLDDAELLEIFESQAEAILARNAPVLTEVIRRSILVKARVVESDYREGGRRAILNLGHTFAHALESVAGFGEWTHGEAVAWGIARAARLGEATGHTPAQHAERIIALLTRYGYRIEPAVADPHALLEAMRHDKKRAEGAIRFVIPCGVGETVVEPVDEVTVLQGLVHPG